jgi:hypothetical protein
VPVLLAVALLDRGRCRGTAVKFQSQDAAIHATDGYDAAVDSGVALQLFSYSTSYELV